MRNNSLSIPPNKSAKKSDREMEIIVNKLQETEECSFNVNSNWDEYNCNEEHTGDALKRISGGEELPSIAHWIDVYHNLQEVKYLLNLWMNSGISGIIITKSP